MLPIIQPTSSNKKKKKLNKEKNRPLFNDDFSKFDTETGDKTATDGADIALAKMEALSEAKKTRRAPFNKEEAIKDAVTGGSLSYLMSRTLGLKDSRRIKALTSGRKNGLLGLAAAGAAGAMSIKKQKGEYNRQQASRELLSGKKTDRADEYKNYLKSKYNIGEK